MLSAIIFLPLTGGLLLLLLPRTRRRLLASIAMATTLTTLVLAVRIGGVFAHGGNGAVSKLEQSVPWVPAIGAKYALFCDGISYPLVLLTVLLTFLAVLYSLFSPEKETGDQLKEYLFLFLLMETGLLGTFLASDLLLFYVFWEVALVPLYFIIGIWGHEQRREAALKFFLYTRAGTLALLLAILGLYLKTNPRSFSMTETSSVSSSVVAAFAGLVLLGFTLGFGVKLPMLPIHSWLPDAHVQAPTAGSVMLAGLLLKMGGYGFIRIMLPSVHAEFAHYSPVFAAFAVAGIVYAAFVALAQRDFKRMVAFTSINHMGFVLLGVTVAAVAGSESQRVMALNGAVLQMVSHGLLTGGMFFLVGILQQRTGTRSFAELGGGWKKMPLYAGFLTAFAFGSLGLPTMSGFVAEFHVLAATLPVFLWAAIVAVVGIAISTAVYLRALQQVLFGGPTSKMAKTRDIVWPERIVLGVLLACSFTIGLTPAWIIAVIESGIRNLVTR